MFLLFLNVTLSLSCSTKAFIKNCQVLLKYQGESFRETLAIILLIQSQGIIIFKLEADLHPTVLLPIAYFNDCIEFKAVEGPLIVYAVIETGMFGTGENRSR